MNRRQFLATSGATAIAAATPRLFAQTATADAQFRAMLDQFFYERLESSPESATRLGLDIRYVVTNITTGTPEWLYADLYCARGQAENLIKLHKAQLASDRTSCTSAVAARAWPSFDAQASEGRVRVSHQEHPR